MEYNSISPGFEKIDESTVINKDNMGLAAYRKKKMRERKIDDIQNDVANLKEDIQEIKQLLRGLSK